MSLTDIEQQLQEQVFGGQLTFADIGFRLTSLGAVLVSLPPISAFPLTGVQLSVTGSGAAEKLTITGTVAWDLLTGTTATLTVTDDPSTVGRYLTAMELDAPDTATIGIPGVSWLSLGSFAIGGTSIPATLQSSGLLSPADVWIGTTLLIEGQSHKTPIPIRIERDPTGVLMVSLNTSAVALPSINDVLATFGGGAKAIQLPSTINDLASFSLEGLYVGFDPRGPSLRQIGVQIGKQASDGSPGWAIIPGFFTLDRYALGLTILDPLGTAQVGGMVSANGKLGSVDIGVAALHPPSGGWQFSGYLGKQHGVPIGTLVQGLASQFGVVLPDALASFTLNDFEFAFDTLTYNASGRFSLDFDVNGTPVDLTVAAALTHQGGSYTVAVDGVLLVGDSRFEVSFGKAPSTFTASWSDAAHPLEFGDIAARFGFSDVPAIPASVDLQLVKADITYDFATKSLVVDAVSKTYGAAAFVASAGQYVFGLRVDRTIDLTDLPLLKTVLGPAETVGIRDLQVIVASAALDAAAAKAVNLLLSGTGMPQVPVAGMAAGVALSMTFQAGTFSEPLILSTGDTSQQRSLAAVPAAAVPAAVDPTAAVPAAVDSAVVPAAAGSTRGNGAVASATSPDGTVWYSLQKQFGPVTFGRVGIRYQKTPDGKDGVLYVVMDAGLDAGGLSIAVLGLGVGSPLTTFDPRFTIDGVAVSLAEGPVTVSGGMLGTIDPTVNFYGEIVLGFTELTISALGGYAEVDGHPSFFLYAVLDYPIGGPPFFFVTGIAAGLGFNRSLVIPDITGVTTFPLVAWAKGIGAPPMDPGGDVGEQVRKVLTTLASSGVIAPAVGSYWLALGVRFTSFEIVDAFALLTVTFGTRFEIDLLGVATLSIPPAVETPIARAELALKASFAPTEGILSVEGQLTNNSYILDQAAHLTGGFAFYSWFAGPHEGDFVVTLGGYNPNFLVPAHYPKVPRLGLSWQVIPELSISGDLYFALTSNAVMAGGQMSAVWESGPIRAWFTVWADFLMVFKPFHYYISAGIDLGASFSFKLLFVHVRLTIHVGVSLQLWGPPFAGVATVYLYIVSFDIHFGLGQPSTDTTLAWSDFVDQMLPVAPTKMASPARLRADSVAADTVAADNPAADNPAADNPAADNLAADADVRKGVVQVSVTQGLLKTLDANPANPTYLVDAERFQCQVTSAILVKTVTWAGIATIAPDDQQPHDTDGKVIVPNTDFTAGVSNISAKDFQPALVVDVESEEDSHLYGVRVLRNAPKALWETKSFTNGVPQVDTSTGLTDTTVANALVGFVLLPEPPTPDHTLPIPQPVLEDTVEDVQPVAWSTPTYATTDSLGTPTVAATIATKDVGGVRSAVIAAMAGQSLTVNPAVNVASLADPGNDDLTAAPALSLLGEQRAAALAGSEVR